MTERKKKKSGLATLPGESEFRNSQLDLFQSFLCNTAAERDQLSNTIDLWDSIPRYSVSRQAMMKMRTADGFLDLYEISFAYKGAHLKAIIQPARIREEDGRALDYYPSATEELVEDALRKIAAEQDRGFFDKLNYRCGVVFSLYMLREELRRRGHSRSYQEIMKSLQILSGSLIEIRADEGNDTQAFSRTNYLPALAAVSRKRLRDNPEAKWVAQFHPLITQSVDALTYRQFNYHRMMAHNTQLARWLHKQLALKFTFASATSTFDILYSTIKRDSALVNYKRERDGIDAVSKALEELRAQDVLQHINRQEILGVRGKIEDVKYALHPTLEFIREAKAANKRLATAVDNSPNNCG
ncbi:replication protein [Methylomagnum sp.]